MEERSKKIIKEPKKHCSSTVKFSLNVYLFYFNYFIYFIIKEDYSSAFGQLFSPKLFTKIEI